MKVRDAILAFRYREGTFLGRLETQEWWNEETSLDFFAGFHRGESQDTWPGSGFPREKMCGSENTKMIGKCMK